MLRLRRNQVVDLHNQKLRTVSGARDLSTIVVQETCQLVSSELVTITIDVNGFTNIPRSFQVLQQPPNAAHDFTLR